MRGDQHHHPPDLIRIERLPRPHRAVGQDRKHHYRDKEQPHRRGQLLVLDVRDQRVQLDAEAENRRHHDCRRRGDRQMPQPRHRAQGEGDQRGNRGGDADVGGVPSLAPVTDAHQNRDREDRGGEENSS